MFNSNLYVAQALDNNSPTSILQYEANLSWIWAIATILFAAYINDYYRRYKDKKDKEKHLIYAFYDELKGNRIILLHNNQILSLRLRSPLIEFSTEYLRLVNADIPPQLRKDSWRLLPVYSSHIDNANLYIKFKNSLLVSTNRPPGYAELRDNTNFFLRDSMGSLSDDLNYALGYIQIIKYRYDNLNTRPTFAQWIIDKLNKPIK